MAAQPKNAADRPSLSFKHITLLPSCGKAASLGVVPTTAELSPAFSSGAVVPSAAEYASLYHELRLARASGVRIKSLAPTYEDAKPLLSTARDRIKGKNTLLYRIQI